VSGSVVYELIGEVLMIIGPVKMPVGKLKNIKMRSSVCLRGEISSEYICSHAFSNSFLQRIEIPLTVVCIGERCFLEDV
jgi:hypothetical protein